jgi:hypothetical protein
MDYLLVHDSADITALGRRERARAGLAAAAASVEGIAS